MLQSSFLTRLVMQLCGMVRIRHKLYLAEEGLEEFCLIRRTLDPALGVELESYGSMRRVESIG